MTAWQILEIEPTTDLKTIKKAYAKQLKLIDQESEPEKFITLREALQEAQFEAENNFFEDDVEESVFLDEDGFDAQQRFSKPISPTITDVSAFEENYQILKIQIETQYIHLNLNEALYDFKYTLEACTNIEIQNEYLEKYTQLLEQNHLEDFIDIFSNKPNAVEKSELTDPQDMYSNDNDLEIEENEFTQLNIVVQALYSEDISDESYTNYHSLLTQQYDLTLTEQLQLKDQLIWPLAELQQDVLNPRYTRFLDLWAETFPEEIDLYDHSYASHALQEKIDHYQQKKAFLALFPSQQIDNIQKLSGEQKFYPFSILSIQRSLRKKFPYDQILNQIDQLNLVDTEHNVNYLFLKSISQWKKLIWGSILFSICLCNSTFFSLDDSPLLRGVIFLISTFVFFIFIQIPVQAWITARKNQDEVLTKYSQYWFIAGLILVGIPILLHPILHEIATYIWMISTIFLIGSLQITALPYMNQLFQESYIKMDIWVSFIGLGALMAGFASLYYNIGNPEYPWLILYSLIPISLILFPDSFRPLFNIFGYRKTEHDLTHKQVFFRSLGIITLRLSVIFISIFFFTSYKTQPFLLLTALSFSSLYILILHTKLISALLKYISYILLFLLSLQTIIFAGILAYYMFKSYQANKMHNH